MSRVHVTTQVFLSLELLSPSSLFHPRCKWKTENISCFHLKAALTPHQPGRKARKCKEIFEASCDIFMVFSERLSSFLNPVHAFLHVLFRRWIQPDFASQVGDRIMAIYYARAVGCLLQRLPKKLWRRGMHLIKFASQPAIMHLHPQNMKMAFWRHLLV